MWPAGSRRNRFTGSTTGGVASLCPRLLWRLPFGLAWFFYGVCPSGWHGLRDRKQIASRLFFCIAIRRGYGMIDFHLSMARARGSVRCNYAF